MSIWREVCSGEAAGVLVSGEAGVGKTRLLIECANLVGAAGGQVLSGACVRISTGGLPYGPLLDAFRRLLRDRAADGLADLAGPRFEDLDRLLRTAATTSPAPFDAPQTQIFEDLLAILGTLSREAPLLFTIDDLHWAEQSTLDLLSFLTVGQRRERILLVVTYRDDEPVSGPLPSALLELQRSPFMSRIPLAPFTPAELADLLESATGAPVPEATVQRIADLSGGNAFFAEELLAAQGLDRAGALPARVRDVVLLRVATLSPDAQEVVRTAAVVGRRVSHALLAATAGLPKGRLLAALRELVAGRILVVETDRAYRFRHALAQDAVYSDLLPGERAHLHAAIAAALSDDPHVVDEPPSAGAGVIAYHWDAAGDADRALPALVSAGRAAMAVHGYTEGLGYLQRALAVWLEAVDPATAGIDRPDLLAATARCAFHAGDQKLAIRLTDEAFAALGDGEVIRRALLHEALGSYLSRLDDARALESLQTAYALLVGNDTLPARARVTAALAQALSTRGRYAESTPYWEETLELARRGGGRREEILGLRTSGWHLAMHGDPDQGIARLRQALRIATADGDIELIAMSYNHLCLTLDFTGHSADCLATAERALQWSTQIAGLYTPILDMLDSIVLVLFRLGRWRQAEEAATRIQTSPAHARAAMTAAVLVELATARGNFEQAARDLKTANEIIETDQDPLDHGLVHSAAATCALWREQHTTARAEVNKALEVVAAHGDDQQTMALYALGIRIEADEADRQRARGRESDDDIHQHATQLLTQARVLWPRMGHRQASFPEAAVDATAAEAEFARLAGQTNSTRWHEVAAAWQRLDRPYPLAYARWRQAEALITEHDTSAGDVLRQAAALAKELDARTLAAEVVALARRARIPLDTPQPQPTAEPTHPFHLTDRELQVLALLKEGRRNREIARTLFMSESTASVHVSNILAKLNVKNRLEAAAVAHRLHLGEA